MDERVLSAHQVVFNGYGVEHEQVNEPLSNENHRHIAYSVVHTHDRTRPLDRRFHTAVQRMSVAAEEPSHDGKSCDRCLQRGQIFRYMFPLIVLIGCLIYLGFALYLNASKSVYVCVIAGFVILICVNVLTKGKLKHNVVTVCSKLKKIVTPKNRRTSLWLRR